ncbi:MAG TPA: hypothetical protein VLY04_14750 [Bryobacteraceae bacterium]|nr:hypothetical protein [Bryobacteraceae bacterium]
MQQPSPHHCPADRVLVPTLFVLFLALVLAPAAFGQQTNVTRFDMFTGYAFLDSPHISLFENGFQFQFGVRPRTWYSLGFDYSISQGNLTLTPNLLPDSLSVPLLAEVKTLIAAGLLPPNYALAVDATSRTNSFAIGPQLAYRHFKHVTLFLRPSIGAIHESATPKPNPSDVFAVGVVKSLAPSGVKTDWQGFYGFGYGFDILLTNHFAIRTQGDLVWDHLFNDVLKDGRWTTRFSVGPCFNFGKNIAAK